VVGTVRLRLANIRQHRRIVVACHDPAGCLRLPVLADGRNLGGWRR
jgi:hypothetical protein